MVLTLPQIEVFLLILARVAGIFLEAPLFSARTIPGIVKMALAIWLTLVIWFIVPISPSITLPQINLAFAFLLVKEIMVGFLIGFVCQLLFAAIQSAGDFIDLQMGMSIATALDPSTGAVSTILGRLCFFLGVIIFLITNGHHMLLSALYQSFRLLPLGAPINLSGNVITQLILLGGSLWLIALQLATPALILIFLSDFSLGIVSRVAPQVNVFMLGFQLKPIIGLLALLFSLPLFIGFISLLTNQMMQEIIKLLFNLR